MSPYRTIPRSVRELILRDLARQTRTAKGIAERHHVPVEAVTALRNDFGPGPVELLRAALTEHEHREQLVLRVRDAIAQQGLYLTADQVRLVLDAIEAA